MLIRAVLIVALTISWVAHSFAQPGPRSLVEGSAEAPQNPLDFTVWRDRVYFLAETPSTGYELWSTDGTSQGTILEIEFNPGPDDGVESDNDFFFNPNMAVLGDALLLSATDGLNGYEIWRLDEDHLANPIQLDLSPGTTSSNPTLFTAFPQNNIMLLSASNEDGDGREPWVTDGTRQGSRLLREIGSPGGGLIPFNGSQPQAFTRFGENSMLFSALTRVNEVSSVRHLWHTDGTTLGTRKILSPSGHELQSAGGAVAAFGDAFLVAVDPVDRTGVELWRYSGPESVRLVVDLYEQEDGNDSFFPGGSSYPGILGELNGELLVLHKTPEFSRALFATDGTAQGTHMIAPLESNRYLTGNLTSLAEPHGRFMYFFHAMNGDGLWLYRTDGQSVELLIDRETNGTRVEEGWLYRVAGNLIVATHGSSPSLARMWMVDEFEQRLVPLELNELRYFMEWGVAGDTLYFRGFEGSTRDPWMVTPDSLQPDVAALSGTWYDPATSGQGFLLHPLDDERLFVTYYGFGADGERLWLTGLLESGLGFDAPLEVPMLVTRNGSFGAFDPGAVERRSWGSLELDFSDCQNASAQLSGEDGVQSFDLVRLAGVSGFPCRVDGTSSAPVSPQDRIRSAGLTGAWFDPETSGQGFVIHPINDSRLVVSMFTYAESGDQLWLIGTFDGSIESGLELDVPLTSAQGTNFQSYNSEDVNLVPWGSARITFTHCLLATAVIEGIDGQQSMNLTKLTGVSGSGCGLESEPVQLETFQPIEMR